MPLPEAGLQESVQFLFPGWVRELHVDLVAAPLRLLQVLRLPLQDDLPGNHDSQPVAEKVALRHAVRGHQDTLALLHGLPDHLPHQLPAPGVHPAGRLVHQNKLRTNRLTRHSSVKAQTLPSEIQ